jgi:hypothetical protein
VAGPRQLVDAPTFTPSPYGLLSVAETPAWPGAHWQNGVTWSSYCPDVSQATYDECITVTGSGGPPPEPSTKAPNVDVEFRGATPFTAYARFDCSPVGNEEAIQIATDVLNRTENLQVERTFWTGVISGSVLAFPHLAANAQVSDASGTVLQTAASPAATGSGAYDISTGLGLLEQELAECFGGVGVIHVPVRLIPTLDALGLLHVEGSQLRTLNGNLVAAGAGYPGTSPAGLASTEETTWIYATGPVFLKRGDVKVNPFSSSVNREVNTVEMIVERTYVIGFDCCHAAIQVELGTP